MLKKFFLIGVFAVLLSCGFSTVDVLDSECKETLKIHPNKLLLFIDLNCSYDSKCSSVLHFSWMSYSDSIHSCYANYEYKFVSKKETKKIHLSDDVYDVLDSDEHVRFSLFDKNNVEKSYDIDLSEIIHSYTYKGDSVEIKMPESGFSKISIECPYCSTHRIYDSLCQGIFACNYQSTQQNSVIVGTDSSWGKSYGFDLYLGAQSSMKTDSIHILAEITFR
ncbi:hypothetical protein [Fibrobacter sp.]|uniref:hypothetical protein n=1 Tax=Fibrobacter sp. TaxID=35828 RepID=UPI002629E1BB|nr:hypothetical protein [Fibrobacter sp.]MDD5941657.1 hypothetical protein [Fibrobacter sp.]